MESTETRSAGRAVGAGVVAGVVAAAAMGMFAMVAGATYLRTGFFTPMYHIASTLIGPDAMEASMQRAADGNLFYLQAGPAALGLAAHLLVGAVFGAAFGIIARALRLRGGLAVAVGVTYGLLVLVVMSFVGLPIAASLFDAGDPIAEMPSMVGWPTFTIEHALFCLVLGIWPLVRPGDVTAERPAPRTVQAPSLS
jgi:hypothetical protein